MKNTKIKNSQEDAELDPLMPPRLFSSVVAAPQRYEYYLSGRIGDPWNYNDICNVLRNAVPDDLVVLRINSEGGQIRSAIQIINAIKESQAFVVGYIEQVCMSAATFIFLSCDDWVVTDDTELMCHTTSAGVYGKEHETYDAAVFSRKHIHGLLRRYYEHFLYPEELEKVLAGNDVYLDADEVDERLQKYAEYLRQQEGQEIEISSDAELDESNEDTRKPCPKVFREGDIVKLKKKTDFEGMSFKKGTKFKVILGTSMDDEDGTFYFEISSINVRDNLEFKVLEEEFDLFEIVED